jgi:predicted ester cyclase
LTKSLRPISWGHDLPPGLPHGIEGLRTFRRFVMAALPDQTGEIQQLVAEGDKVAARIRLEGTHRSDLMGRKASGKRLTTHVFEIVRIANGKIAERWALLDRESLIQQLDAPSSSSSGH